MPETWVLVAAGVGVGVAVAAAAAAVWWRRKHVRNRNRGKVYSGGPPGRCPECGGGLKQIGAHGPLKEMKCGKCGSRFAQLG